ncbi:MAG TPA: alanine--tRNA ligase [Candidatus Pacearchaeota archaeon]|nr:alanine--tRNA ligase [Candidatus Pacearchaeota archaeon]
MTRKELIKKYFDFFKKHDHKVIPSASLVPENDPTLFISAGMHPLVPYLLGQKHPSGKKLVSVQKCIRTTDIDEVGDTTHHTFFEMLGNWSLGDYWKKEAIEMSFEFLTSKKWLGLDKKKIAVSYFKGDKKKNIPIDTESKNIWKSLEIPKNRRIPLKEDNWWGPAGETGPCGPDTEMFYWSFSKPVPEEFNPNDSTLATGGKGWVEIWNDVFMQYNKTKKGKYEPLKQKNVDTGMGVERTLAVLNNIEDNYMTEVWKPIINEIEKILPERLEGNISNYEVSNESRKKAMRIIADHVKASVFIIADGIVPSNTQQGYVLRRLIRRAIRYGKLLQIRDFFLKNIAESVFKIYGDYPELKKNKKKILEEINKEEKRFRKTLEKGLKEIKKMSWGRRIHKKISGKEAFLLYQSYGFPIEIIKEVAIETGTEVNEKGFYKELEKHQKLSRTSAKGKFSSGLEDNSEQTTKLHTATHLLNQALRQVLNKNIKQKGSNITPERLRFDFNFDRKLMPEEIKKIEALVNKKISEGLKITSEEIPLKKAMKVAQAEFGARYPKKVSVYTIGNFSKEICTGPHVKNTKDLGKFKIIKEESSAAGVRRIKAVVE